MPTLTDKQRTALATLMSDDVIVGRLTIDDVVGALYALTGDASGAHIDRGLSGVAVTLDVSAVARVLRVTLGDEAPRSHVEGFGYLTDAERAGLEREDRTEEEIDFAMTGDYGGKPVTADERDPVEVKIERDAVAERHRAEALAAKGAPGVVADPPTVDTLSRALAENHRRSADIADALAGAHRAAGDHGPGVYLAAEAERLRSWADSHWPRSQAPAPPPVSDPVMEHMRSCGARRGYRCDCADWEHPER